MLGSMFVHSPPASSRLPLCFVTDYRLGSDVKADDHAGVSGKHVLEFYKPARTALNPRLFAGCSRVALFEAGSTPTARDRLLARQKLLALLQKLEPQVVLVIPNESGGEKKLGDTVSWRAFSPPDGAAEMRGTFFKWRPGMYICPLHASSPWAKQLQRWQQERFIKRALSVAKGHEQLLLCKYKHTSLDDYTVKLLQMMRHSYDTFAVDIESIESTGLITAIGVSDGAQAISFPYDRFTPYGAEQAEKGYMDYGNIGQRALYGLKLLLRGAKQLYFHNHTFDVPRLQAEGFELGGELHDTFAAHAISFPELRHGLQTACADMLPIPPWKSLWHPKGTGFTRDDEEYWCCDPQALRDYNADDAFYTWHLAQEVMPYVHDAN